MFTSSTASSPTSNGQTPTHDLVFTSSGGSIPGGMNQSFQLVMNITSTITRVNKNQSNTEMFLKTEAFTLCSKPTK